jgi:hypothetical protein
MVSYAWCNCTRARGGIAAVKKRRVEPPFQPITESPHFEFDVTSCSFVWVLKLLLSYAVCRWIINTPQIAYKMFCE